MSVINTPGIFQRVAALEARSDSMQRSINLLLAVDGLHVPDQEPLATPPPGYTIEQGEGNGTGPCWRWYACGGSGLEVSREKARAATWAHYTHAHAPLTRGTEIERLRNEVANYRTQCAAQARDLARLTEQLAESVRLCTATSRDCNATALERELQRDANTKLVGEVKALRSKLDERDAERAELRRDADRYRKLRALQWVTIRGARYQMHNDIAHEIERLRKALQEAREKLVINRAHSTGEYHGGMEHVALLRLIDAAL